MSTAIILLAAGESKRLGEPKQLLPWNGESLLARAARTALDAALGKVIVVLGFAEDRCRAALAGLPVEIVVNRDWAEGMGGSIAAGARALGDEEAAIVMLCDQPRVTASALRRLCDEQQRTSSAIVASRHGESSGPPALFTRERFAQLRALRGPSGARSILSSEESLAMVECPGAAIDIDTREDWRALSLPAG